jgi:hypothetical protein
MPDDWQERAQDMRKLREAFDTADVDGDNQLELEELEMVILSMNAKADIQPTVRARPGRLSALSVPQLFPMKIHCVWGFCTGAQGA